MQPLVSKLPLTSLSIGAPDFTNAKGKHAPLIYENKKHHTKWYSAFMVEVATPYSNPIEKVP